MKYIGVTLVFAVREKKSLKGVLRLYIIKCNDPERLFEQAAKIGEEFVGLNEDAKYLGIADLNRSSGPLKEGEILAWESFTTIRSLELATKNLKPETKGIRIPASVRSVNWGCSLVYFYTDPTESKNSFAFSVLTILKGALCKDENIERLATKKMINKIVKYSGSELMDKNIQYLGAKDFFSLSAEDIKKGNCQNFYKNIRSEKEIKELILRKAELSKVLNDFFFMNV